MIYLKLGGSLITDKSAIESARRKTIKRIAQEIAAAKEALPQPLILIGHGSGSFGHQAAAKHGTASGTATPEEWVGFSAVWHSARTLHNIVLDILADASLPIIGISPSASAICRNGEIESMAIETFSRSVEEGLLPITHGDVAIDVSQGACIVSTETVFRYLSQFLPPTRFLFAGSEVGVFPEYPPKSEPLALVQENALEKFEVGASAATDVTGGMRTKVEAALMLSRQHPECEIRVFSGEVEGAIKNAIIGKPIGSLIRSSSI